METSGACLLGETVRMPPSALSPDVSVVGYWPQRQVMRAR